MNDAAVLSLPALAALAALADRPPPCPIPPPAEPPAPTYEPLQVRVQVGVADGQVVLRLETPDSMCQVLLPPREARGVAEAIRQSSYRAR
jgi:hypothetical protein